MITKTNNSIFSFHRHLTGGLHASELLKVDEVLLTVVLI
jgi:hypothetical protein